MKTIDDNANLSSDELEAFAKDFRESSHYIDMMSDGYFHHISDWVCENDLVFPPSLLAKHMGLL